METVASWKPPPGRATRFEGRCAGVHSRSPQPTPLDRQKEEIVRNTRQFLAGGGANNLLLWGPRGTGKSSLVKAVFTAYRDAGLRLIEVDKDDLIQLPEILEVVGDQCDWAEGPWEPVEHAALQWALRRGSRSGRTAWQFARDWVGRSQLEGCPT